MPRGKIPGKLFPSEKEVDGMAQREGDIVLHQREIEALISEFAPSSSGSSWLPLTTDLVVHQEEDIAVSPQASFYRFDSVSHIIEIVGRCNLSSNEAVDEAIVEMMFDDFLQTFNESLGYVSTGWDGNTVMGYAYLKVGGSGPMLTRTINGIGGTTINFLDSEGNPFGSVSEDERMIASSVIWFNITGLLVDND